MKSLKTLGAVALLSTSMLGAATSFAADTEKYPANPDTAQTPVKAKFSLPKDGGSNPDPSNPVNPDKPTDPEGPNTDGNKPLNSAGPFGIAYVPNEFMTQNFDKADGEVLQESGEQTFAFKNTDARVGVKDKTHTQGGWTLKAKLSWDGAKLPGSTILIDTPSKVQVNEGSNKYSDTAEVTTQPKLTISDVDSDVMQGQNLSGDEVYRSTFDLQLQNPTLRVADAGQVAAGTYTGNVTWTLTAAAVY